MRPSSKAGSRKAPTLALTSFRQQNAGDFLPEPLFGGFGGEPIPGNEETKKYENRNVEEILAFAFIAVSSVLTPLASAIVTLYLA